MKKRPKIICLCGSSRFCSEIAIKKWELEKQGIIAIGLHLLPSNYSLAQEHHQAEFENVKEILDELHFRKIDLSNEVFIMNIDGYIGEQTRKEIEYSEKLGKPIKYLEVIKVKE